MELLLFHILPPRLEGDGSLRKLTKRRAGVGTAAVLHNLLFGLMRDRRCVFSLKRICPIGKVERFLDAKRGTTMKADYAWQELYEAAILETDRERMQSHIREAKAAIDARLHGMQVDHGGTPEERSAISDALAGLNTLRREIETRDQDTGSSNA